MFGVWFLEFCMVVFLFWIFFFRVWIEVFRVFIGGVLLV